MRGYEGVLPIIVPPDGTLRKRPRKSGHPSFSQKIGVDKVKSFLLKDGIEEFENLPADKFIIPIYYHENFLGFTVIQSSLTNVSHRLLSLLIDDDLVPLFGEDLLVLKDF